MAGKAFKKIGETRSKEKKDEVRAGIEFALALGYALEKTGRNQKFLAEKLNKEQSEISKWLSGFHNPTWGTITKIEKALEYKILYTSKDVDDIQNFNYSYTMVGSELATLSPVKYISAKSILPSIRKVIHFENESSVKAYPGQDGLSVLNNSKLVYDGSK